MAQTLNRSLSDNALSYTLLSTHSLNPITISQSQNTGLLLYYAFSDEITSFSVHSRVKTENYTTVVKLSQIQSVSRKFTDISNFTDQIFSFSNYLRGLQDYAVSYVALSTDSEKILTTDSNQYLIVYYEFLDNQFYYITRNRKNSDTFESTDFYTSQAFVESVLPKLSVNRFPYTGKTIAYNMQLNRFSLPLNNISNSIFPSGLYVFYIKNGSIFYKFKTDSQDWGNEYLLTGGSS